jgi:hypothetical protein
MESDDALIEHLCMPADWTQPLHFMMIPEEEMGKDDKPEPKLLDILSISDITYKGTYRYYFPRQYKPSDPCGHQLLTNDLRAAGLSLGVKFSRTGGGPSKGAYPLVCNCAMYYRPNAAAATGVTATEDVAGFTYKTGIKGQNIVNQRNKCRSRSATKNPLPKKCRTKRPKKGSGSTCKARLTFYADLEHDRFSIQAYNGNRYHSNHHQVKASEIPIGVKDLGAKTVKFVQAMHEAELNHSSVRNLVYQQPTSPAIGTPSDPLPPITPESSVIPFSPDDPQVKKRPAYFHSKDELTDICRLSEGHEHAEEFVSCVLLLIRGALSGSHSSPTKKAQMKDFSRQARAMFSNGQPPSQEEALSQLKRVLLPTGEELHSFNASVETESMYKRKRRFDEK